MAITLSSLEEEAKKKKADSATATREAADLAAQSDQLIHLVDQLEVALPAYAEARAAKDPEIKELNVRFEAIHKDLTCKLPPKCPAALETALDAYDKELAGKQAAGAALATCTDDKTIPGAETKCAEADNKRKAVQAAIDALPAEGANLRLRVDALKARAEAIEAMACARTADQEEAYVAYLRAKRQLDHVYWDVKKDTADVKQALLDRLEALKAKLDTATADYSTCAKALEKLRADHEQAAADVAALQKDDGLAWIKAKAEPDCAEPAAGQAAV